MSDSDNKQEAPAKKDPSIKNKDSMKNVIVVSLLVCFVCSVVVSSAAVLLKPERIANKDLDRNKNILQAAGLYDKKTSGEVDIEGLFKNFEVRLVDLKEQRLLSDSEASGLGINPASYDQRKAAKDPAISRELSSSEDIASISRQARYSVVYILRDEGKIDKIVIPIHGYGLWSTLYGFISLEGDMNTVSGITFYEHGETAGLGGEVDNPEWKSQWVGKKIYERGEVALRVIKGTVDSASPMAVHQIDGLSGASLTSRGVQNLVSYWLGSQAFGPILEDIRS